VPEKARILLSTTQYSSRHYIKEPFERTKTWLRPRKKAIELSKRIV